MQAIWKFPLQCADKNVVEMPRGSQVLCVQNQNEVPCLWALVPDVTPECVTVARTFTIYGTGHQHELISGGYVGTFQLRGGSLVFHVFEEKAES